MWHLYLLQYHVYWHMTLQRVPAMQKRDPNKSLSQKLSESKKLLNSFYTQQLIFQDKLNSVFQTSTTVTTFSLVPSNNLLYLLQTTKFYN